jgi:hypothetical protein
MRPQSSAEVLEPIPPTLRDGEPRARAEPASDVVPRGSTEDAASREGEAEALALLVRLGDDAFPGRILAALGSLDEATAALGAAVRHADAFGDPLTGARARHALGLALWAQADPRCRAALEDAGTMFEELGDDFAVRAIDGLLRDLEEDFEESPRSFQSASPVPPPARAR